MKVRAVVPAPAAAGAARARCPPVDGACVPEPSGPGPQLTSAYGPAQTSTSSRRESRSGWFDLRGEGRFPKWPRVVRPSTSVERSRTVMAFLDPRPGVSRSCRASPQTRPRMRGRPRSLRRGSRRALLVLRDPWGARSRNTAPCRMSLKKMDGLAEVRAREKNGDVVWAVKALLWLKQEAGRSRDSTGAGALHHARRWAVSPKRPTSGTEKSFAIRQPVPGR